jgi:hypothetical protein
MAVVMDGAIAAAAGIIAGGAEVVATIMVGGIIAITGDVTSKRGRSVGGLFRVLSRKQCRLGTSRHFATPRNQSPIEAWRPAKL